MPREQRRSPVYDCPSAKDRSHREWCPPPEHAPCHGFGGVLVLSRGPGVVKRPVVLGTWRRRAIEAGRLDGMLFGGLHQLGALPRRVLRVGTTGARMVVARVWGLAPHPSKDGGRDRRPDPRVPRQGAHRGKRPALGQCRGHDGPGRALAVQ